MFTKYRHLFFMLIYFFLIFALSGCRSMIVDEDLMKKISSLNFKLALVEAHFVPCSYILPHILKIPHVS